MREATSKNTAFTLNGGILVGFTPQIFLSHNPPMSKKLILKELKTRFSGKTVLFAEDLSSLIGSDHRVVKCLRAGISMPLPTIKQGRRWGIQLDDVADWMASRTSIASSAPNSELANRRLQAPARKRESLGRSLLGLKLQIESLEAQLEYMNELYAETLILHQQNEILLADRPEPQPKLITRKNQT